MKSKNTIELNGLRYDTVTGAALDSPAPHHAPTNMDGFFRNPRRAKPDAVAKQQITVVAPSAPSVQTAKPKTIAVRQHQASHVQPHKPQPTKTLMRTAVSRPAPGLKQQTQVQGTLQHKVPSLIASKRSAYSLDEQRLARANEVEKSPLIARHAAESTHVPVTFVPLSVQPVPVKPEAEDTPAPAPHDKPLDMFEHAVANASHYVDVKAHGAQLRKHRRNHTLSLAAGSLALIVIAGFAAYQNNPGLQFRVASLRAGVSTNMPNFKAAGFAYNGAKATDGKLLVGLKSNGAKYQLTQQTTNLTSDDMIQNVASTDASGNPAYSTVQAGNTTVYRFANNDATWVADGQWYTVSGTSALTNSQVTSLVKNL